MKVAPSGSSRLGSDLPYVTISFAMSLDGKIATRTGDSKYISGPESLAFVHRLRDAHDAILVGINTILADHPRLTARLPEGGGRDPHRVILDSTLRIPLDEPVLHAASPAKTILVCREDADPVRRAALERLGAVVVAVPDPHDPEGLRRAIRLLKAAGIGSILVEGGASIHFAFLGNRLFDRVFVTVAPLIIGGATARTAVAGNGFATLAESVRLRFVDRMDAGNDIIIEALPADAGERA